MNRKKKRNYCPLYYTYGAAIALLEHVTQNARNSKSKGIKSESNRSNRFFEVRFGNTNPRIYGWASRLIRRDEARFSKAARTFAPSDTRHWHNSIVLPRDHERALGPRSPVWTTRIYRLRKPTTYYIAPLIITDICGWRKRCVWCVLSPRPLFADTNRCESSPLHNDSFAKRFVTVDC